MHLLIFVLNKEEHLEEVLELFLELDIPGATIIDSIGMGRILAHDIPIFAGFRSLMQESRPGNKTIFTVVEEKKYPASYKVLNKYAAHLINAVPEF